MLNVKNSSTAGVVEEDVINSLIPQQKKQRPVDESDQLTKRAKSGDRNAFNQLVTMYQERLYYTVIRIVLNHDDARDVVQESFLKAYRYLDSFIIGNKFYTWLYRIAINSAINVLQQRRFKEESLDVMNEETGFDPMDETNLEEQYIRFEMLNRVKKALDALPPEMRAVFALRVYEGMSYQEITETLHISMGSVMSRLHRARNIIKGLLVELEWC